MRLLRGNGQRAWLALVWLGWHTGHRLQDLLDLVPGSFSEVAGVGWCVSFVPGKTGGRAVVLPVPDYVAGLARRLGGFASLGVKGSNYNGKVSNEFVDLLRAAGVDRRVDLQERGLGRALRWGWRRLRFCGCWARLLRGDAIVVLGITVSVLFFVSGLSLAVLFQSQWPFGILSFFDVALRPFPFCFKSAWGYRHFEAVGWFCGMEAQTSRGKIEAIDSLYVGLMMNGKRN